MSVIEKLKISIRGWLGYPLVVGLVALATWGKYLAQPTIIPSDVPILYFLAIVPSGIFFGLGPAILACFLSAFAFDYFFLSPLYTLGTSTFATLPILGIFLLVGVTFSFMAANLRRERNEAVTEVEERKRAEAALVEYREHLEELVSARTLELEESGRLYRSLFENMLNGVAFCKMLFEQDKPSDFVYLSVNSAFVTSMGLQNVTGKRASEVVPGLRKSNPELFEIFGRVASTGTAERFETYVHALDMWLEISVYSPQKEYFVTVTDVITARKKAEQLKDEFIGLISHELRTPLTVISGSLQTALSAGISPEDERELLQNAFYGAGALGAILENMLELSRQQAGRLHLRKEPVSVPVVTHSIIKRLKERGASQRFLADFPNDLPEVAADPVRVERILYNLLENATKYSPDESLIKVFARIGDACVITGVSDEGKGIAPSMQGRLFKVFERLDGDKLEKPGLGLGLVVCKRLAEAQGGDIWIESEPGKGSTFLFSLPTLGKGT